MDRRLFGSDQMVWPAAYAGSVESIESAKFLDRKQKYAVFYGNAARLLGSDAR